MCNVSCVLCPVSLVGRAPVLQQPSGRGPPDGEGVPRAGTRCSRPGRQVGPILRPGAGERSPADPDGVQDARPSVEQDIHLVRRERKLSATRPSNGLENNGFEIIFKVNAFCRC